MIKKFLGLAIVLAIAPLAALRKPRWEISNIAAGTHEDGNKSYLADAAHTLRHLVVKIGTDADHIALAGTADIPIGVCDDQPEAAEDQVNVQMFGATKGTKLMVASAAISAGAMVVSAASGKIRTLPATTGTYYIIGRAIEAAGADGDEINVAPCFPTQRVVA